ncbi:MAG: tRNA pseudouridine(55) synthase TruB [Anaerolineales bacterium]|nr:MAG: tRNA pseudouridine(55) synthase TruB [Anaerolineales bacterium]
MNGILVVNKPSGMTSHDVVNIVRRLFGTRRVGHTGTLDPMATGVLVMLLGPATRLAQFMVHNEKRYLGTIRLGIATSTYDAEGEIVAVNPVEVGGEAIQAAVARFQGDIQQIPPMYSALKVHGQKLYDLARQGITIEREPRAVTIYHSEVVEWQPPDLVLDIQCSAGTYIRSLAHDIGEDLGCGAHLHALTRTSSHGFSLAESYTLETLNALAEHGNLLSALLAPRAALGQAPVVILKPAQVASIRQGQSLTLAEIEETPVIQALDLQGALVAVMIQTGNGTWRPKVVMPAGTTD